MFRFSFLEKGGTMAKEDAEKQGKEELNWIPCKEIHLHTIRTMRYDDYDKFVLNDKEIFFLSPDVVGNLVVSSVDGHTKNSTVGEAKRSDLIPAVYEGGLKVWECTTYLLQYLEDKRFRFLKQTVLDLGCGSGLLGIYASMRGAKRVHFQDYNEIVLRYYTIPNIVKNNVTSETRFFSGDWDSFVEKSLVPDRLYDVILSSETIYNPDSYKKIRRVLQTKLKRGGVAFISAKTFYFGVGGNIEEFKEYLKKTRFFDVTVVWRGTGGVICEILRITLK